MKRRSLSVILAALLIASLIPGCNKADTSGVSPVKIPAEADLPGAEAAPAPENPETLEAEPAPEKEEEKTEPAAEATKAPTQETTESVPSRAEETALLSDAEGDYQEILEKYRTALKEGWDEEKLIQNGLSYMLRYSKEPKYRDNVGYMILDINGDGTGELFIGKQPEGKYQETIYQIYTLKNGKPVLVTEGGERDGYYLCVDNSTIYREGSGSAFDGFFFSYLLDPGSEKLRMVEGLLFDERADEKNPWFFVQSDDFDASKGQPITEDQFNKAQDAFASNIKQIDYKSFGASGSAAGSSKDKEEEPVANNGKGYTQDELCKMAQDYYERHYDFRPPIAEPEEQSDGMILIHLYEQMPTHTATSAWYMIDPKTGKGYDYLFEDEKIDLNS